MRYLILFLLAGTAYASEPCETGAYFQQTQEEREEALKNWKKFQEEMKALKEENKRLNDDLVMAQGSVDKMHEALEEAQTAPKTAKNHRVVGYIGAGPSGLDVDQSGGNASVKPKTGMIGGLGYGYKFDDSDWSINGLFMTNPQLKKRNMTGALGLGYDF